MKPQQLSLWTPENQERSGANLSPCGLFRWTLWRSWGAVGYPSDPVNFVMLNPSRADAVDDDNTVEKCIRYAKDWGYDGLVVTNLYAFRATDPKDLKKAGHPVGNPGTDLWIRSIARTARKVVCAWGANAGQARADEVLTLLKAEGVLPHALRLTKGGMPWHPLYLPGDLKPFLWNR